MNNASPSVEALMDTIKVATTVNRDDIQQGIENGEITVLYNIEKDKTDMATTWVHEMAHLLMDCKSVLRQLNLNVNILVGFDQPAWDAEGNPLTRPSKKFSFTQMKYIDTTITQNTYTWEQCVNLARKDPNLAAMSPENAAIFAKGVFLDRWDWSRGYARPVPQ
jgi:hypothetical protein